MKLPSCTIATKELPAIRVRLSVRKYFTPSLNPSVPGSRSTPPKSFGAAFHQSAVWRGGSRIRSCHRSEMDFPAESWLLNARFLNPMTETARATFCWQRSLQNGYAVTKRL